MSRAALALAGLLAIAGCREPEGPPRAQGATPLPSKFSDAEFWRIATEFSEPEGTWDSDNFLSDERGFQRVIPELQATLPQGGVYIGVGPEQNFTYVAALRPRVAFLVDIRRGNLLLHLFYKALFELSADRAEFLSKLFARPRPAGLQAGTDIAGLLEAYRAVKASEPHFRSTLATIRDHLAKTHAFPLSADDLRGIERVAHAFFTAGPDLDYNFPRERYGTGRVGGEPFPTYAELMTATDPAGRPRSYLASDENFEVVAALQRNNALIPLVGDFAGPRTLRALARFVADYGATVIAFYTSNVELYLFRSDAWKRFYANVATIPVTAGSTFIRFCPDRVMSAPDRLPGPGCTTRLGTISDLVKAATSGELRDYYDVIERSR